MENRYLFEEKFTEEEARELNPLVLAFVGDAVYEVFVRTYLVDKNRNMNVHKLHVLAIQFVKAHSQSEILKRIYDKLSEDELYFFKRGRNAKSGSIPKNADVQEYRFATGLESLIGYLYLTKKSERLEYLLNIMISFKI